MDPVLEFERVAKKFVVHTTRPRSFLEMAVSRAQGHRRSKVRELWALQDVSLIVGRGELVGIIGDNGAGKSTMLKLAARIIVPTRGQVVANGRVGSLLEVGVGFHGDLTGRENIYLSAALIGLTRREIESRLDEIIAFSGVGEFVDAPVRRYSAGMLVRLGFSVATSFRPDILLVDEVLAVGDQTFRQQCLERISDMRSRGTAILYVSHNLEEVRRLCDRAMWLDDGRIQARGNPEDVVQAYVDSAAGAVAERPGTR
jgi:ABC-type polysaccharide/polyol phosphate transport system ATPase subunit